LFACSRPFNEDSNEEEFFDDMDERRRKRSFSGLTTGIGNGHAASNTRGVPSNFTFNSTEGFFTWQELYKVTKVLTKEHMIANLSHFQEYSIEVSRFNSSFPFNLLL